MIFHVKVDFLGGFDLKFVCGLAQSLACLLAGKVPRAQANSQLLGKRWDTSDVGAETFIDPVIPTEAHIR